MFKDKEEIKTKLTAAAPPSDSAPHAKSSADETAAAVPAPDEVQSSKFAPQVETPHITRKPLVWWRRNLQYVVIAALTAVTVPMTLTHMQSTGDDYLNRGDPSQAIIQFEKQLNKNPRDIHSIDRLARLAALQNRSSDAIGFFTRELALAPNNAEALRYRALLYVGTKQYDKALADLDKLQTSDSLINHARVTALVGVGRLEEATALCQREIREQGLDKDQAFRYLMRAHDYSRAHKIAQDFLQTSTATDSIESEWIRNRADASLAARDYQSALADYDSLDDGHLGAEGLAAKAVALRQLGKFDQAIKTYKAAVAAEQDAPSENSLQLQLDWQTAIAEMQQAQGNHTAKQAHAAKQARAAIADLKAQIQTTQSALDAYDINNLDSTFEELLQ